MSNLIVGRLQAIFESIGADTAVTDIAKVSAAMDKTAASGVKAAGALDKQAAATKTAGAAAGTAATGASKNATALNSTAAAATKAAGAEDTVAGASKRASAATQAEIASRARHVAAIKASNSAIIKHKGDLDTVSKVTTGLGIATLGTAALAVRSYASFDEAMSAVAADTNTAKSALGDLRTVAIKSGADTKYSATEAAYGIDALAKAGMKNKDIISGGLTGSLGLAAAGNMDVADAADLAASSLNAFGLDGSKAGHVADLLAAGAGKAQGSVSDLGQALNQSQLVAKQNGLSIEETTGALAEFASKGLLGSDAGTSFKTMLQAMNPTTKKAKNLVDQYNISAFDQQGNFIGLANYAGKLQKGLSGLSQEQQNTALKTIFGSDSIRAASILMDGGAKSAQSWINKVNDSGYAAETAAKKMDNLSGDMETLGASIDTVFIQSGGGMNDILRKWTQGLTDMINTIGNMPQGALETMFSSFAVGGGAMLAVVGIQKVVVAVKEFQSAIAALRAAGGASALLGNLSAFAGPAGLAIAGIATAIALVTAAQAKAKAAAEAHKQGVKDLIGTLDQETGAYSKATKAYLADQLTKSKNYNKLKKAGISTNDVVKAELGDPKAMAKVNAQLSAYRDKLLSTTSAQQKMSSVSKATGVDMDTVKAAASGNAEAIEKVNKALSAKGIRHGSRDDFNDLMKMTGAYKDAEKVIKEYQKQVVDSQRSMLDTAFAAGDTKKQVTAIKNLANIASASGKSTITVDAATGKAQKQLQDLDYKVKKVTAADGSKKLVISVDTAKVERKINALRPQLSKLTGRTNSVRVAAQTENATKKLRDLGYSVKKVPGTKKVDISTNAGSTKRGVETVSSALKKVKGKKITLDAPSDKVIASLRKMDVKVKKTAGGKKIEVSAETAKAKKELGITTSTAKKVPKEVKTKTSAPGAKQSASDLDSVARAARNVPRNVKTTTTQTTVKRVVNKPEKDANGGAVGLAKGGSPLAFLRSFRAGRVNGVGSGTSDSVPTMLSREEHVSTADEVSRFGGQGAFYRLRQLIRKGLTLGKLRDALSSAEDDGEDVPTFKKGGKVSKDTTVSDAKKAIASAKHDYDRQKSAASAQKKSLGNDAASKAAKRQIDDDLKSDYQSYLETKLENKQIIANAKKATKAQRKATKKSVASTNKALASQAKATAQADIDETNASNAATRANDRQSMSDTIAQSGTSALADFTNGNSSSYVGDLSSIANSDAYTDAQRKKARDTANASTAKMTQLNATLDTQKSKLDDLNSSYTTLHDSVKSTITGYASMTSAINDSASTWEKVGDGIWKQSSGGVTNDSLASFYSSKAADTKKFVQLLTQLTSSGFPTGMVQEVAAAGVEDGTKLANALLSMSADQKTQAVKDYNDIQTYGEQAGTTVANQAYASDIAATTAAVNATTAQIEQTGKDVIAVLNSIYGTHYATGGDIVGPGSNTADKIPIMASNEEFMVRAAVANKYRGELRYINKTGKWPHKAGGGDIGTVGTVNGRTGLPPIKVAVHAAIDGRALDDSMTVTATAVYDERAVQEAQQWEVQ